MKRLVLGLSLLCWVLSLGACRSMMYSTYEKFGVYKRDLLRKQVTAARDEQKQAQQEFKDALTRLKEMTGYWLSSRLRASINRWPSANASVMPGAS